MHQVIAGNLLASTKLFIFYLGCKTRFAGGLRMTVGAVRLLAAVQPQSRIVWWDAWTGGTAVGMELASGLIFGLTFSTTFAVSHILTSTTVSSRKT